MKITIPFRRKEPFLRPNTLPESHSTGKVSGNEVVTDWSAYVKYLENRANRVEMERNVFFGATLALLVACITLYPLKQVVPVPVRFGDPADKVYILQPGRISTNDEKLILLQTARDYVIKRETINHVDERERDNWLRLYTQKDWFNLYLGLINPNNQDNPRVRFAKEAATREIHPISVSEVPSSGNGTVINVNFKTIDRRNGQVIQSNDWIATLLIYRQGMIFKGEEANINPLGITVANYAYQARNEKPQ